MFDIFGERYNSRESEGIPSFKVTENQLAITSVSGVRVYHIDFESNQIGTWELLLLYTQIGFQSPFHTVV